MRTEEYGKYLSQTYDFLNTDIDYAEWADFYKACFEKYGPGQIKNVCEMACGTGNMALEMQKRGYSVTAFDLSEFMLTVADKKAFDKGVSGIRFTMQDMRSFKVYTKAQAVICMLDSINCLMDTESVLSTFESVFEALCEGGVFIFDVNSKYKFENVYSDNAYILEDEKIMLAWQNFYNPKSKKCDLYLNFFLEEEDGRYTRVDEHIKQRMYTVRSLDNLLKKAGFEIQCKVSGFDFKEADENTDERIFYICKKMHD